MQSTRTSLSAKIHCSIFAEVNTATRRDYWQIDKLFYRRAIKVSLSHEQENNWSFLTLFVSRARVCMCAHAHTYTHAHIHGENIYCNKMNVQNVKVRCTNNKTDHNDPHKWHWLLGVSNGDRWQLCCLSFLSSETCRYVFVFLDYFTFIMKQLQSFETSEGIYARTDVASQKTWSRSGITLSSMVWKSI